MRTFLTVGLLSTLLGCESLPTPTETQQADYGAYPDGYQNIVTDYLTSELRDPASIEIKGMSEPKKRWIGDKVTGTQYGYLVCAEVNSKNWLGKMTGFRSDALLIRNGNVVEYIKDGELLSGMQLCN